MSYVWLCHQNGIPVKGGIYNMLRKKAPTIPEMLKKGGLSKNMAIDTDYSTYYQAIVDNGLNPQDYTDILENVKNKEFFKREVVIKSRRMMESFEQNLTLEALDMTDPDLRMYPNLNIRECASCRYRNLCRIESDKGDVPYAIQHLFIPRPNEDDEELPDE